MKKPRRKNKKSPVIKSVSMPAELWSKVENAISKDPEMTISKYFRQLIRKDIAA